MPRFFVRQNQVDGDNITILGEDAHHIARSLRMAVGDEVTVCDMQGNEYQCRITDFYSDEQVTVNILNMKSSENESPVFIRLFQALPKGDKLDTVIQKAVECGASEIIPFESERCIVRIRQEGEDKKSERRNRIASEAAKQSGRSVLPLVKHSISFSEMLDRACESEAVLFCYEGDGTEPLGRLLDGMKGAFPKSISIVIGSEGGFSLAEVEKARASGLIPVGLGKRILRTETASGFVLGCLCYEFEL